MIRGTYGYPVLSAAACRQMDAAAEAYGIPTAVLMENAGRAVAVVASELSTEPMFVAVGSGNNGGDALVAARILQERRRRVVVGASRTLEELDGLVALNARRFLDAGGVIQPLDEVNWAEATLIVDGLLGTGVSGAPQGAIAAAIDAINASGVPVVSIDIPSGLFSDSCAHSSVAIRAAITVSLACYKHALIHFPAAEWAGEVILADIGCPAAAYPSADTEVLAALFVRDTLPQWKTDTNKGARGALVVVAGSRGMTGAPAMACNAAVNSGAGLVFLACPEPLAPVMERKLTEAMVRTVPSSGKARFTRESVEAVIELALKGKAVVVGPGMSQNEDTADFLSEVLPRLAVPALLDADALNIISVRGLLPPSNSVLTPHPGEMARLLGISIADVQADRVGSARAAAMKYDCVVVLKGAHTVVAAPGQPVVVNTVSHNVLATAGSGDVLSGVIGALLAQGLPPMHAALAGVRWHGTMGVLAASKVGGTAGAATMIKYLPQAREEILTTDEIEVLV